MNLFEKNLLNTCVEMMRNPNMNSELVRETTCASLEIVRDRLEVIKSPVLELDVTEAEYNKYFKDLFISHGVAEQFEDKILEDANA